MRQAPQAETPSADQSAPTGAEPSVTAPVHTRRRFGSTRVVRVLPDSFTPGSATTASVMPDSVTPEVSDPAPAATGTATPPANVDTPPADRAAGDLTAADDTAGQAPADDAGADEAAGEVPDDHVIADEAADDQLPAVEGDPASRMEADDGGEAAGEQAAVADADRSVPAAAGVDQPEREPVSVSEAGTDAPVVADPTQDESVQLKSVDEGSAGPGPDADGAQAARAQALAAAPASVDAAIEQASAEQPTRAGAVPPASVEEAGPREPGHDEPAEADAASAKAPAVVAGAVDAGAGEQPSAERPFTDQPSLQGGEIPGGEVHGHVSDRDGVVNADLSDAGTETSAPSFDQANGSAPTGASAVATTGLRTDGASERPASTADRPHRGTTALAGIAAIAAVIAVVVALAMFLGRSSGHKSSGAAPTTPAPVSASSVSNASSASSASTPSSATTTSPSTSSGAAGLPVQTQLSQWAKANLSTAAIIAADAEAAPTLRAAGFAHVVPDTSTSTDWRTVAYLVRNAGRAKTSTFGTELAAASAPVALFGNGASGVTVSEVEPQLGSTLAARIKADRSTRRLAGTELVKNSMLRFSASAKKVVAAGQLDLRPASFLVQLARTSPVYVIDVVCNASEIRAGRACRTIVVSTGDMNMLAQTLTASALEYKPTTVRTIDHDAVQLQWIPAVVSIAGG